jgi:hypothetical protein
MRFKDFYRLDESLYANERKLRKLLSNALGRDVEEFIAPDGHSPDEIIYLRPSILFDLSEEELKKICTTAGYYCSIHHDSDGNYLPFDPIFVTPINQKEPLHIGMQEYYHCSLAKNLDQTGLRLRSRHVDDEYDIYEDRIYLCPVALCGDLDDLIEMVAEEHRCSKDAVMVYKVTVPKGYPIYQDPTKRNAVYVTNAIPAKYIKKLNVPIG